MTIVLYSFIQVLFLWIQLKTIAIHQFCYCICQNNKKQKIYSSQVSTSIVDWFSDNQFIVVILMIQWKFSPRCLFSTLLVWSVLLITQIKGSNPDILAFIWCWHFFSFRSGQIRIQFSEILNEEKTLQSTIIKKKLALFKCIKNYNWQTLFSIPSLVFMTILLYSFNPKRFPFYALEGGTVIDVWADMRRY